LAKYSHPIPNTHCNSELIISSIKELHYLLGFANASDVLAFIVMRKEARREEK